LEEIPITTAVIPHIAKLSSLKHLSLRRTNVSQVQALGNGLPLLEELDLGVLISVGEADLIQLLSGLPLLKRAYLDRNVNYGDKLLEALTKYLKVCKEPPT
jgi:hypothetical protein